MLVKLFGIALLVVGGIVAFCLLMALIGTIFGILFFALKVAVPVVLVYLGYRLITRDRHQVTY
jgi:threonine/homoserine/homoserine lactone efflux protein